MAELLELRAVTAGYGDTVILESVSLSMPPGTVLALLGKNGVGKSTLLNTVMGLTHLAGGQIRFGGEDVGRLPTYVRAARGLAYVPQERDIFKSLTVEENLVVARKPGEWTLERAYQLFPRLRERRGNYGDQLSGGEQQMLAVARALVSNPKLLLLDEPFEGLAPVVVDQLIDALAAIRGQSSLPMILVEHRADLALEFADSGMVLDRGRVVWQGDSAELLHDDQRLGELIGLADADPTAASAG